MAVRTRLALDLSSCTGWTFGSAAGRIASGVWRLPNNETNPGKQFSAFCDVLCDALGTFNPDEVVMEGALNVRAQKSSSGYQQLGLAAHAESMAYRYDKRIFKAASSNVRSRLLGTAHGHDKPVYVRWARANGHPECMDHNEAESFMVLCYSFLPRAKLVA
jgi:hypothetical protein